MANFKKWPLRAETIQRISAAQTPVRPSTPEEMAGALRSQIELITGEVEALAAKFEQATGDKADALARQISIKLATLGRFKERLADYEKGGE